MDAVTSFELEAQRRRETIAADRGVTRWRTDASTDPVELAIDRPMVVGPRRGERMTSQGDCQPAALVRTTVG